MQVRFFLTKLGGFTLNDLHFFARIGQMIYNSTYLILQKEKSSGNLVQLVKFSNDVETHSSAMPPR